MENKIKVCMLSCLHGLMDDRIYWKEALSLQNNSYEVIHVGVGNQNRDFISEHGIRLIETARKRFFSNPFLDKAFRMITFSPNIYKKLFRIAAELQADVYHFHDLQLNRIGPKLKKLPHKPKVIYDVHEPYPEIARYLHTRGIFKNLFWYLYSFYIGRWQINCSKSYDTIITTEHIVAGQFQKNLPYIPVKIIWNYSTLTLTSSLEKSDYKYDLIYTGGISSWRGIMEMLETTKMAKDKRIPLKVLFIGIIKEKGLGKKILRYISDNKLEDYFELKNFVPYNEINSYYDKSWCGLSIFRDNPVYHILMPIKIFEYMAMGLPFICNNFGHPARIAEANQCGMTIEEVAPSAILSAVLKLREDPALYHAFSKNARKAYSEEYSWPRMEKELMEVYRDLLK